MTIAIHDLRWNKVRSFEAVLQCGFSSDNRQIKNHWENRKKTTSTHHHLCFFLFSRQAMTKLTLEILTPFQFCMWMRLIHWQSPMDWWCKTQDESSCICPILTRFDFHIVCIKQLRSQSNMANSWDHVYRVWQATIIRILINLTVCICIHRLMN